MRSYKAIAAAILGISLVMTVVGGCSLLTTFEDCSEDADCLSNFGPRAHCEDKLCVVPTDRSELLGATCQETVGPVDDPGAFVVAILLPLTGDEAGFGLPLLDAVRLAWGNFDQIGGIGDRAFGLLICDTEGLDDVALAAARHAVDVGRVTAIIGPDFSSQTIDIAAQITVPNNVLLVTPSGTAPAITDIPDNNLVWRTAPSDTAQSAAIAELVVHRITGVQNVGLQDSVVWLLTREGDAYSDGLREGLIGAFPTELSNSPNLFPSAYPDNWDDSWYTQEVSQLPAPDIVVLMGAAESWDIAEQIDTDFGSETIFVFADAARNEDEAASSSPTLEGRILGTAPRTVGDPSYTPYTTFRVKYRGEYDEFPDGFQFVANAYDAVHVVALAVAGGGGISGPQLAAGMAKLSNGDSILANSTDAQKGIRLLSQGQTIDFEGASGRLDFDANGDPSASAIALWCFDDGKVPLVEAAPLLSTEGEFTPLDCTDLGAANADPTADMGSSDAGMSSDMASDAADMG